MIRGILETFAAEVQALDSFETDAETAPDLRDCVREARAQLEPAFLTEGASLAVPEALLGGEPLPVVGRRDRLVRVLCNLLDNALRHGPRGGRVQLTLDEERGGVVVGVEDEGPGVPAELRASLFDKFAQGPAARGISGLGLYYCRLTVERWGGSIGCEDRPEGGARFWFRLPQPG